MKPIHKNRKILETKCHERVFTRGTKQIFHFENIYGLMPIVNLVFKMLFIKKIGLRNATRVGLNEVELGVKGLPANFDGCRILFITDMHLEGIDYLSENIINIAKNMEYDYCFLGGDYSFRPSVKEVGRQLAKIVSLLTTKSRVFGVLGNHDTYRIAEQLNDYGVEMLLNENVCLERGAERVYLVGVDDCYYFAAAELKEAEQGIPDGAVKIILSHPPELYKEAEQAGYSLYVAGHTHGGQICLPGGVAMVVRACIPRKLVKGDWRYRDMVGYTSCGAGATGVPVRFFCPPEVALLTLRKNGNQG